MDQVDGKINGAEDNKNDSGMSRTNFAITFKGPSMEDNSIDVHDLVPSLMAASELLSNINQEIN